MWYALLLLWFLSFCFSFAKNLLAYLDAKRCLSNLTDFIVLYGQGSSYSRPKYEVFHQELTALLRCYPAISKLIPYPKLDYAQTYEELYLNAITILNKLQMKLNFLRHSVVQSLNPFLPVSQVLLLPVALLRELGFQPGKITAVSLNAAIWVITYLLEMFRPEIKMLILYALDKLP